VKVVVAARRIKPGAYDLFRAAWEPPAWSPGCAGAYIMRDPEDDCQILSLSLWEPDDADGPRAAREGGETAAERDERMRPHVHETLACGAYEVVDARDGAGGEERLRLPLRMLRLKPDTFETWHASWLAPFRAIGEPPEGLVRAYALRGLDDPDVVVGMGFFRGDWERFKLDHHGALEASRKAQDRVVDRIWLDAAYELVEEVVPAGM
jgi:hypothetical protein